MEMKRIKSVLALVLLAVNLINGSLNGNSVPIIKTSLGSISGTKNTANKGTVYYSYKSVPYAKPPIGNLRFKDPVPLESWQGILDATKFPDPCPKANVSSATKSSSEFPNYIGNENCLYMSIYTHMSKEKLPVMVYIHGGAFIWGRASYVGPKALMDKSIVLVVLQYRLGIFGFFSTEDSVLPGNMGLKDQQMALKWIQGNIQHFGGDPDQVTIFGASAGGASVHYHMLSPGSKGLFKGAISHSGTSLCPWASNTGHRKYAIEIGSKYGCSIVGGTEQFLQCMQNVDTEKLALDSISYLLFGFAYFYVLPRVDGVFLPDSPAVLLREGKYNKVNFMSGITKDEGALTVSAMRYDPNMTRHINENFEKYGPISIFLHDDPNGVALSEKIYKHYLKRENISISRADEETLIKLYSDSFFKVCYDVTANFHAVDPNISLYLYIFNYEKQSPANNTYQEKHWVSHEDDLQYLFSGGNLYPLLKDENDLRMSDLMLNLWTNFAKTGNPNSPEFNFTWAKANSSSFQHIRLELNPKMENDTFGEVRNFWASLKSPLYPSYQPNVTLHSEV